MAIFPEINEEMIFTLKKDRSPQEVKLLQLEWAVVTQLDGEKTVGQIAENLALNSKEINEILERLGQEDLLDLVENSDEDQTIPNEFFTKLNHEMTFLLGPVASIVINDVLETMRKDKNNFEKKYLPSLVDMLTNQIDDPIKQIEFQKNIYKSFKTYLFRK
jgi:hypothetical protein